MTIKMFVLKGDLNGGNRSGAFLFLSGIYACESQIDQNAFLSFKFTFQVNLQN